MTYGNRSMADDRREGGSAHGATAGATGLQSGLSPGPEKGPGAWADGSPRGLYAQAMLGQRLAIIAAFRP